MKNLEVTYEQQQLIIRDDVWFSVLITFWNENDDEIKEEYISTQYPNPADIEKTLEMNGLINNCKCYGGAFDYFEVTKVEIGSCRNSLSKLILQNIL
jgi:hypothetical protein